jgi:hypothetical protein
VAADRFIWYRRIFFSYYFPAEQATSSCERLEEDYSSGDPCVPHLGFSSDLYETVRMNNKKIWSLMKKTTLTSAFFSL